MGRDLRAQGRCRDAGTAAPRRSGRRAGFSRLAPPPRRRWTLLRSSTRRSPPRARSSTGAARSSIDEGARYRFQPVARKDMAKELGYTGDTSDSASMNIWLHKQVMPSSPPTAARCRTTSRTDRTRDPTAEGPRAIAGLFICNRRIAASALRHQVGVLRRLVEIVGDEAAPGTTLRPSARINSSAPLINSKRCRARAAPPGFRCG